MNVNMFLRDKFGTQNVSAKNLEEMKYNLVSEDPIQQKLFIKKLIGETITGKLYTDVKKNQLYYNELKQIQGSKNTFMNPLVGFKSLHYWISEKSRKYQSENNQQNKERTWDWYKNKREYSNNECWL